MIRTRFAPSPTGYLHLGGARTALFAWAYAQKNGGEFLLRIEDTDAARSSAEHTRAIIDALQWLGIAPDAPPVLQSANIALHRQSAERLLDEGKAYRCYCTAEELAAMRADGGKYDRRWRDSSKPPPAGGLPVVRFKMPLEGETVFTDEIKGKLSVNNAELDDFIILRSDNTPTYNLAAVADDVQMQISDVIRGDDHIMNTYRQWHLFAALVTPPRTPPRFAHLPMILAADGENEKGEIVYARMSKRNAAVDVNDYRRRGYLPAAVCNYLARLSWSSGDAEFFSQSFLAENFNFASVSASAARFDLDKLNWLNREHLRALPLAELREMLREWRGGEFLPENLSDSVLRLAAGRATTLADVKDGAEKFIVRPQVSAELLARHLPPQNRAAFLRLVAALESLPNWAAPEIKKTIKEVAAAEKLSFRQFGMPLRVLIFGAEESPDIAESAEAIGKAEVLARLRARP